MKILLPVIICAVLLFPISCKKKEPEPVVDIDQVGDDGYTRDRYIFREQIRRERESREKELTEEFR